AERAILVRKRLGGWMRQAGHLAAAALLALEEGVERLAEDHALARGIASRLGAIEGLSADPAAVDTNIVMVTVVTPQHDAASLAAALAEHGVRVMPMGERVLRFVTHRDVGQGDLDRLEAAAQAVLGA
ncbi:MAG: beta-eliminating lyase-related protein, partial [Planctomycetota bacterium]|nr:beta-eliminating lyase-related protein [Planctomycetota bacterium]